MRQNIDHVEAVINHAWMKAKDVARLYKRHEGELAECNFLEEMVEKARELVKVGDPDFPMSIEEFWWSGEGSGRSFEETFVAKLAPKIMGVVEAVCTWEGGEWQTAFRIEDGVYEECDVAVKVTRRKKAK